MFRFAALLLALAACLPNLARAQSADALIEQGIALRSEGRDAEALPLFVRAFAEDPSPRPEGQLGLVQLGLGQFVPAELHLRRALASSDAWVESNRVPLTEAHAAAAEHVGTVEIVGGVDGAQVRVNGVDEGTMPLGEAVTALVGRCVIDVTAPGFRVFSTELTIRAGQPSRVSVDLVPSLVVEEEVVTNQDWFWPVILGGAALVLGGVVAGVVLGTGPHYSDYATGDTGVVFFALEGRP